MHVEEQLSTTVLGDDGSIARRERVNQVPVPMVQVDADILAEVRQTVLHLQVSRAEVSWNADEVTLNKRLRRIRLG